MNIQERLRDADPLSYEPEYAPDRRELCRRAVLAAAVSARAPEPVRSRSRIGVFAAVAAVLIAGYVVARVWSPFISTVEAAVRFEARLAEDKPAPGLHEAKVGDRAVYLHDEAIVTNGDIAAARVVPGGAPSQYYVNVEFTKSGAEKMRAATGSHVGMRMAMLVDGKVVTAPTIRSAIGESAVVSGDFTKAQAERIAKGIMVR